MMKILHVINSLQGGGAEKFISQLLPLLNTDDFKCDLLVLQSNNAVFQEELEREGINVRFSKGSVNIYSPLYIFSLMKYLKGYDIIHVHLFPSQYWVSLANLLSFNKAKIVTTEHSTSNKRINTSIYRPIEKFIYSRYSKIISISQATQNTLLKWLGNKNNDKFQVIENGTNLQVLQGAMPHSIQDIHPEILATDKLLIMVARFDEAKDHETVLKAIIQLPPNFKLLLVGIGPLLEKHQKYVLENQLQKQVIFLGYRKDVANLLRSSYISIVSSRWEGFGLVAIEAMALGIPVIASNVPGLFDVVDGAGLIFETGNHKSLIEMIQIVDKDADKRVKMIEEQYKRASKYNIKTTADKHIKLYKSLMINNE